MKFQLRKSFHGAFGWHYDVFVKVKRESEDYWPWERLDSIYYKVMKYDDKFKGKDRWVLSSQTDKSDKVMRELFGADFIVFEDRAELRKAIEKLIPLWIGKDYSGGNLEGKEFVFAK